MRQHRFAPFLTFNGQAEEAMRFYAANLPGATITKLERYGSGQQFGAAGEENKVLYGEVIFMGQPLLFLDMDAAHPAPGFTWSSSIYIDCANEKEFDTIFDRLSQGGTVMMGPEAVGQLRKCAWLTDRFGITWQPVWA